MDSFTSALFGEDIKKIPEEYDWFSKLLGDWDFDYYDGSDKNNLRHVKGEWIFRRILNSAGIEDLFICPSRKTMYTDPQPDGEYGLAVRMFNKNTKSYDMVYTCEQYMIRLEFKKDGDKLVGTVINEPNNKWVFSEITEKTFHWQNITVTEDEHWQINSNVYARRK